MIRFEKNPLNASSGVFWLLLILLHVVLRASTLWTPLLDIDESQFAGFAHVLMDGGKPYVDSLDTKPLGIYYFYAFCFSLFGRDSMFGVHLIVLLWNLLAAFYLYKMTLLFSTERHGRLAALFFTVFTTTFIPKYVGASINSVMVPLLIFQMFAFAKSENAFRMGRQLLNWDFFGGVFLGMAMLFKYQAGIQWPMMFFLVAVSAHVKFYGRVMIFRDVVSLVFSRVVVFSAGVVLPLLSFALWLFHLNVWNDFWEWSIAGSGRYIAAGYQSVNFWGALFVRFFGFFLANPVMPFVALISAVYLWRRRKLLHVAPILRSGTLVAWIWFAFGLVPVSVGGRFYSHYFLQVVPALSLLAAMMWDEVTVKWQRLIKMGVLIPALFFLVLRLDYGLYLKLFPDEPFESHKKIGLYLRNHSESQNKIYVWGFATPIYFYSGMKPASRFLWSDWKTGRSPGPRHLQTQGATVNSMVSQKSWDAFWSDMIKNSPRYFVDTASANFHGYGEYPLKNYPELMAFLRAHYHVKAIIDDVVVYEISGGEGQAF